MLCPESHQLADIYVVLLQLLQHVLHCCFVGVLQSIPHINIRWNRLSGFVIFKIPWCWITKIYDKINFLFLYSLRTTPCYSCFSTFPYLPFIYYTHLLNYTLWLYTTFGSAKNWLTQALANAQQYTGKQTFYADLTVLCTVDFFWWWIGLMDTYIVKNMCVCTLRVETKNKAYNVCVSVILWCGYVTIVDMGKR